MTMIVVSSGVVSSGLVVSGGEQVLVQYGGTAVAATVEHGGVISNQGDVISADIGYGGALLNSSVVSGAVVQSGGFLTGILDTGVVLQAGAVEVLSGTSYDATIASGATVLVLSAGVLSGAFVQSGAEVVLLGGASAVGLSGSGEVVSSGLVIVSGGTNVVVAPAGPVVIGSGAVEYVLSGGVVQNTSVTSGGLQILEGGTSEATLLLSGGGQAIGTGVASGTIVESGGSQVYENYLGAGSVFGTLVEDGGTAFLGGSETVSGTIVELGGYALVIASQSSDISGNFISGGALYVDAGSISGSVIGSGGLEDVLFQGRSISATVRPGGTQFVQNDGVDAGAVVFDTTVSSGGQLFNEVLTSGAMVYSGGVELVLPEAVAADTNIASGGFLLLVSGGSAIRPIGAGQVLSGGVVVISGDGTESINPTSIVSLSGGGAEYVFGGGIASGAHLGSGAQQVVFSVASNTLIDGGTQYVSAGVAYNTDIVSGIQLVGGGDVYASIFGTSGYLAGGTDMNVTIGAAGELDYFGGLLSGAVIFAGSGGVLYDDQTAIAAPGRFVPSTYESLPVISGFGVGDELILPFAITSGTGPVISGGTLTFNDAVNNSPQSFSVSFASAAADNFAVTPLANGTTMIEVTALCFLAGTMIATPDGEIPVERIAIGDVVTTHAGPRPVKWLGRRAYGRRFVAGEPMAAPVCIAAGALGDGVPRRDLHVSPGHGVLLDGQLIPAWRLINGVSITQPAPAADVVYTHIELEDHAIVYAEGAAAETFLDVGLRGRFQNAAEYEALYPGPAPDRTNCFPRLEEGFLLQSLAQRVAKRAGVAPRGLNGRLTGAVEAAGPGWAVGWALDEDAPGQPVCLDVMVYGVPVRRVLANRYRPELRARGLGDGACGFAVQLPADLRGPISVRRSEDHAVLAA